MEKERGKKVREREQDYNKSVCTCVRTCVRDPSGMARLHRVEIKTVFRKILSTRGQQRRALEGVEKRQRPEQPEESVRR